MVRPLVRLAFHDCASTTCDGCIDLADPSNARLPALVGALTPICEKYNIELADCFATAASMALERTSRSAATQALVPLFFGRITAATCDGFTEESPEAVFPGGMDGMTSNKHTCNFSIPGGRN